MANMTVKELRTYWKANKELFQKRTATTSDCIHAGFYDWFCNDRLLPAKLCSLVPKALKIAESSKINEDTTYVFFKNNCPMNGSLYDSFSFCDVKSGDVLYYVAPKLGHNNDRKGKSCIAYPGNWDGDILNSWEDVKSFFEV